MGSPYFDLSRAPRNALITSGQERQHPLMMISESRNSSPRAFTPNRREFVKLALAGSCLPAFSRFAQAEGMGYDSTSRCRPARLRRAPREDRRFYHRKSWSPKANFGIFNDGGPI